MRQQEPSRLLYSVGAGRVKRGPSSLKRPEPSEPRKWVVNDVIRLFGITSADPWFILAQAYNDGSHTYIRYIFWKYATSATIGGTTYSGMPTQYSFQGWYDEYLGIDPDTVVGVWASPVPPFDPNGTGINYVHGASYFAYVITTQYNYPLVHTQDLTNGSGEGLTSDDFNRIQIVDPTGAIYGTIPWGYTVSAIYAFIDIGSAGANLVLSFDGARDDTYTIKSVEGLTITVPLPAVPITSNAASSYYYSGEREYDQTTRRLQREESAVQGITGSAGNAIGGAIAGAMIGGPAGAIAGAAVGLGTSVIGTSINAIVGQEYDKKSQEAMDKLKSNQASNVINMTGGSAWQSRGGIYWNLVISKRDAVSAAELTAEQSELGYITDLYAADCSTIISTGGGLRIEGLEVKGGISREGREYIAALFARGVHIDILT